MAAWSNTRIYWLHGALIALAIQGMTPDPGDVTSGSIARILRSILSDGIPTTAREARSGDDLVDESSDEVCAPASSPSRSAEHDRGARQPGRMRAASSLRAHFLDAMRLALPRGAASGGRRLASLGRLTC